MIKRIFLSFSILFFTLSVLAQSKMTTAEYVEKYHKIAMRQMKEHKIPASITLAQGILESGNGNSQLAKKAKNHFGIKCHSTWKGKRYYMDDDAEDECFRVYKSPEASYEDHSLFLTKRGRYEFLFTDYSTTDYKKWAHGLKKAGYATNPKYPQLLIGLIERYHLYKYDREDYVPEIVTEEDFLVLEEVNDEDFELEQTDEYIKALMGRNVYYSDREKGIFVFNRIKTVKAKNRTPLEIAIAFDVNYELLLKYNDINAEDFFREDQNVFLQPKRFNGSQKDYVVKPGDSMWEISQMFGIKLNTLYNKNLMSIGEQARPGETLNLRRKKKEKINTINYEDVLKEKRKIESQKPKKVVQKTVVKPQETTININIYDKSEDKKVELEQKANETVIREEVKKPEPTIIKPEDAYPETKYVDKNEDIIKIINEIPVVEKETTTISGEERELFLVHIVTQGETLYFLSKKYNVSVDEIKKVNNLSDNSIDIGQEILISQKE